MPFRKPRPRFVRAATSATFLLGIFAASPAYADISIALKDALPRVDASGNDVTKRATQYKPEGISNQDCIDNQGIRLALTLTTLEANASVEIWASAGSDCKDETARTGTNPVCWRVRKSIPLTANPTVIVPVRKIIGGRNNGKDSAQSAEEGRDTIDVCGAVDLTTINLQVLYFSPGNRASAAQSAAVSIVADTMGPSAPSGVSVLPGNTRLWLKFDALGEGGVSELSTIHAYCAPSAGSGVTTTPSTTCDAATTTTTTTDDADADGEASTSADANCTTETKTSTTGTCSSPVFVKSDGSPIQPDNAFAAKYECGKTDSSTTGSTIEATSVGGQPLTNLTEYAVGIAATDSFLNVGPLSTVVCGTPEHTHDFWQDYKNGGGDAGGGFCSLEHPATPVGSATILGMLVILVGSVWRRRQTLRGSR